MFRNSVIFFCLICGTVYSNEANINPVTKNVPRITAAPSANSQLSQLDDLIVATQRSIDQLKILRDLISNFQETQKAYLNSSDDVDLLIKMIKIAKRAQDIIIENHLSYAFDTEFLNEINVFAQMGNKRAIPKS